MSDCNTCGQTPGCNSIDGFDLYSLQTELYPFILVCPPGMYCGDALEFRMSCCGSDLVLVFPQGAVPAEKERLVASAIAECSRSLAFCNPTTDDETVTPPKPGVETRWYYNQPQTCTATCPDGSTFSFRVKPGIAAGLSQANANAVAYRYACANAVSKRVCIAALNQTICNYDTISIQVQAYGAGLAKPPLKNSWSIISGDLPGNCVIDEETGIISGEPNAFGTFEFTVQVVTPTGTTQTRDCSLTVVGAEQVTLPEAVIGVYYEYALNAVGMGPDLVWTAVDPLPDGITLESTTGLLSGTPTTEALTGFVVSVSDGDHTCYAYYEINVNAELSIVNTSPLTSGTTGTAYSVTLTAAGGVSPYSGWTVISGTLPTGLSLNSSTGAITGTPTTVQTSNFTVQVSDSQGNLATKPFEIAVAKSYPMKAWWAMEQTGTSDRIDSINSVHLPMDYKGAAWGVAAATGLIGNAVQFTCTTPATNDGASFQTALNSNLKLTGNGFSIVFWVKFASYTAPAGAGIGLYYYTAGYARYVNFLISNDLGGVIQATLSASSVLVQHAFTPTVGSWYMIHLWYSQSDGKLRISINNDPAKTYTSTNSDIIAGSNANGAIGVGASAGPSAGATNIDIRIDELSFTPEILDSTTLATMYNGGVGNTWPLP